MQYTEEHYAEMYNNLPEGLKDLVLSGRLAILVSAIGSRHGLTADQIADLEPAVEDVCLGLITKDELVDNIQKSTNVDTRVANRIAAETELEILKPFEAELLISRKQKEELDEKIGGHTHASAAKALKTENIVQNKTEVPEPQNISDHAQVKKVSDWYSKENSTETENTKNIPKVTNFDWDTDFAAKKEPEKKIEQAIEGEIHTGGNIEVKLDKLTESINNLVNTRFGSTDKKDDGLSVQMQELFKRLEKAEKENEENKKLIKSLQSGGKETNLKPVENIFGNVKTEDGSNKIQIDKQRKVEIDKKDLAIKEEKPSGNVQITSVSKSIPINKAITSSVSKDTIDSIIETKNKDMFGKGVTSNLTSLQSNKQLSLSELIKEGDNKIKAGSTATLVFPGLNNEKKIDIKNTGQKDTIKQTLLDDLEYLKNKDKKIEKKDESSPIPSTYIQNINTEHRVDLAKSNTTYETNPFKEELIPTTKEDRMKALQDKIKALNKSVSVGGKTNISASGLDPYRL